MGDLMGDTALAPNQKMKPEPQRFRNVTLR